MAPDVVQGWADAGLLEKLFVLFLGVVSIGAIVKIALLAWYLRVRPSGWTARPGTEAGRPASPLALRDAGLRVLWIERRCDALVRSARAVLVPTTIATAWFAAVDWFILLGEESGDTHPTRTMTAALPITASRLATRLTLPLAVVTGLVVAWMLLDRLLRQRRAAWNHELAESIHGR